MKNYDYIIIGQGIAGSVIAHQLRNANYSFLIIDQPEYSSCSKIAAGLFNPIVFKKLNKIWWADTFFPFAEEFYATIENQLSVELFFQKPLCRIFSSAGEHNDFEELYNDPNYKKYISDQQITTNNALHSPFGKGCVNHSGYLDVKSFITHSRNLFEQENSYRQEFIDIPNAILATDSGWTIKKNYSCKKIIFAEGWKMVHNPFFNFLPLIPAKGDVITIHCPELNENYILNGGCFVLPIGNQQFKIGATFDWKNLNDEPDQKAKQELLTKFEALVNLPYQIVKHEAGVRPAAKDRRPMIGEHPQHKNMYVLNGLGTRGVIMAPYLSHLLLQHANHNQAIPSECCISRFS